MKRLILLAMVLILFLPSFAEAEMESGSSKTGRWDFSLMTRYNWGREFTDENGAKLDFQGDLGWGFGFSKYVNEKTNVGLMFNWHSMYYDATAPAVGDPDNVWQYSKVLSTSAIGLYADYVVTAKKLNPYISGNLGWVRANTNITADIDGGCYYYPYYGEVCATWQSATYGDDAFAYGLGLGLKMELSPSSFFKVGYEWGWNSFDHWDSTGALRVDLGFFM